jgi:ankyrin repeat protein
MLEAVFATDLCEDPESNLLPQNSPLLNEYLSRKVKTLNDSGARILPAEIQLGVERLLITDGTNEQSSEDKDIQKSCIAALAYQEASSTLLWQWSRSRHRQSDYCSCTTDHVVAETLIAAHEQLLKGFISKGLRISFSSQNHGQLLVIAAKGNYHNLAKLHLDRMSLSLYSRGINMGKHAEALVAAVSARYDKMIDLLLDWAHYHYLTEDLINELNRLLNDAVYSNDSRMVAVLMECGASPNTLSSSGGYPFTVLYDAITYDRPKVVRALLDGGADPSPTWDYNLLVIAAHIGSVEITTMLLEFEVDIDAEEGEALKTAASYGRESVFDYLIDNGADVALLREDPRRALARAAGNGEHGIIRRLASCGVDLDTLIDGECRLLGDYPQRAIFFAMAGGQSAAVDLLLELGAKPIDWTLAEHELRAAVCMHGKDGKDYIHDLVRGGVNINAVCLKTGATAMSEAMCIWRDEWPELRADMIQFLLGLGAERVGGCGSILPSAKMLMGDVGLIFCHLHDWI